MSEQSGYISDMSHMNEEPDTECQLINNTAGHISDDALADFFDKSVFDVASKIVVHRNFDASNIQDGGSVLPDGVAIYVSKDAVVDPRLLPDELFSNVLHTSVSSKRNRATLIRDLDNESVHEKINRAVPQYTKSRQGPSLELHDPNSTTGTPHTPYGVELGQRGGQIGLYSQIDHLNPDNTELLLIAKNGLPHEVRKLRAALAKGKPITYGELVSRDNFRFLRNLSTENNARGAYAFAKALKVRVPNKRHISNVSGKPLADGLAGYMTVIPTAQRFTHDMVSSGDNEVVIFSNAYPLEHGDGNYLIGGPLHHGYNCFSLKRNHTAKFGTPVNAIISIPATTAVQKPFKEHALRSAESSVLNVIKNRNDNVNLMWEQGAEPVNARAGGLHVTAMRLLHPEGYIPMSSKGLEALESTAGYDSKEDRQTLKPLLVKVSNPCKYR